MTFDAWIAVQRHQITRLHVAEGEYVARYLQRSGRYAAAKRLARTVDPANTVVQVTRIGAVRARALLVVAGIVREYDFEPAWAEGRGIYAHRVSPREVRDTTTAERAAALAMAALLKAAEPEYDRLRGLALDVVEELGSDEDDALACLTLGERLELAAQRVVAGSLAAKSDGVELMTARTDCACVVCARRYFAGERGPVLMFGATAACSSCVHSRPSARAA